MKLTIINWHPFASNPLDYLDNAHLCTPDGSTVRIVKEMTFRIYVNGTLAHESDSNSAACAFLYREEVGIATDAP